LYDILTRCVLVQIVEYRSDEDERYRCSGSSELEVLRCDQFVIPHRILDKRAKSTVDICDSEDQYEHCAAEQDDALYDITPYDTFDSAEKCVDDAEQSDNGCDEHRIDIGNGRDGECRKVDDDCNPADMEEYEQDASDRPE